MYRHFFRICGDPSRAKYAVCIFDDNGVPFVRTYQTYARYTRALTGYLSRPDCFSVTFVKYRGQWVYSSLSHTFVNASAGLLDSFRQAAVAHVDYCLNRY